MTSVGLWWAALTLVLWLLSWASGRPESLVRCAASAVLLVAIGEAGNWLRRRWNAHRRRRRTGLPPGRGTRRT
ncbi:hypothetical protein ABZ557_17880 [Streptomyces sp. NPDC019645]|uniref:hypothetical protein n=1 Tax=Streptomyces sp. NPDC019645 TaxID=3154786 RepID=UPI0033DE7DAA